MKKYLITKNPMLMTGSIIQNPNTRQFAIEIETDDLLNELPEGFKPFIRPKMPNSSIPKNKEFGKEREIFIESIKTKQEELRSKFQKR